MTLDKLIGRAQFKFWEISF